MTSVDTLFLRKAKDIGAGFVGGAVQVLIGQPFDLVKVRLQTGQFTSILDTVKTTLAQEGGLAFYKGTLAPLFGVGACVLLQFYGFHEAKRGLLRLTGGENGEGKTLLLPQFYLAGAAAGIVNTPVTAPVEQLRILLQTQRGEGGGYTGPRDAVAKIHAAHGWGGIFRGSGITVLRETQAYGVWFLTYEWLMKHAVASRGISREDIGIPELMAYGALAGEALWLLLYPLDVVKSRIQSDGFGASSRYHGSVVAVVKDIAATQGVRGFWRGIGPTLMRALPCSAGTFALVELTLRALG